MSSEQIGLSVVRVSDEQSPVGYWEVRLRGEGIERFGFTENDGPQDRTARQQAFAFRRGVLYALERARPAL